MAFDSFRKSAKPGASRARRLMFVAAAVLHGALIAVGVVYSYWHVDELTPPTLRVTFISAAPPPPPPPPPPPAGGGGAKKKLAFKPKPLTPIVQPKPTEIVQPRETPAPVKKKTFRQHDDEEEEDDAPAGVAGGVKGGVAGGVIGGTVGGTIGGTQGGVIGGVVGGTAPVAAPVAAKFLPPQMGALQKESGNNPPFPPSLDHGGMEYIVQAKICVSRAGTVESVTLMKRADALLDDGVTNTVKTWRYRPLMANNAAVPFCYFGRFEFKSHT